MKFLVLVLLVATGMLGGCIAGFRPNDPVMRVKPLEGHTSAEQNFYQDAVVTILQGSIAAEHATSSEYHSALRNWDDPARNPAISAANRRQGVQGLANALLDIADKNCDTYMADLGVNRRVYRTTLTISSTIAGAAGSLASPPRSAATLSGIAGLLSGVRGNLEEEIFANQTVSILIGAMETRRAGRRTEIMQRLAPTSGRIATAMEVIAAIAEYNNECSLTHAFGYANAQVTQEGARQRQNELQRQQQQQ